MECEGSHFDAGRFCTILYKLQNSYLKSLIVLYALFFYCFNKTHKCANLLFNDSVSVVFIVITVSTFVFITAPTPKKML